jgi:DNA-binding NarL/FixJ family response regulator
MKRGLNGVVLEREQQTSPNAVGRPSNRTQRSFIAIVVERRPFIRDLLAQSLLGRAGFEVIATATMDEGLELAKANDAAVVVVSSVGGPNSGDAQQVLTHAAQVLDGTPIVVLSDGEEPPQVMNILQSGARGYISTSMSLDVAIEALRLVQAGGQFVPTSCFISGHGDLAATLSPLQSRQPERFTPRQAEVVAAVCLGKPNKIIAYELNMRVSTVKVHLRNIMKRLNATNRTEVAYITNQLAGNRS